MSITVTITLSLWQIKDTELCLKISELHQWLWPKFVQQELDSFRDRMNNHVTHFDKNKILPSGITLNVAYTLCEKSGGEQCLIAVDRAVIKSLINEIGEDVIHFISPEYEARAEAVFATLGITKLTKKNTWQVFVDMLSLM